ncbi:Sensor histidine kinase RcsC [Paenibacillus solanacearum]|uniref:Sensor histidine kinase RcsC n=1 Tax=Paenibacillus solanacearum TaxID=2048548 RepID=A0A916NRT4_9BACL|nr:PAS domain S-box protein [Paenibacillus solanacearum]CAG7645201.1 Sensor histidine kinase RcsC [Paenibacillus solanacearum]
MPQKQVNVLIVDDRPENLLAMSSTLQSPEYRIVTAGSGEEALRRVLQEEFALILMDVQMPGLNGFETVQMIKSRERSRHIPVIFVTALSHAPEHIMRGYEAGAIDFIFKPLQPAALQHKVEQFVKMYLDRMQLEEQKELISERTAALEKAHLQLLQTTQELRRAEAMARVIGETAVNTFLTVDHQGAILAANPAVERMFGFKPEELHGLPVWRLLPDTEPLFGGETGGIAEAELGVTTEKAAVRRDLSIFPAELQIGVARIGEQSIYVCSVHDITERKLQYMRLERAVEKRTQELREANLQLSREMTERSRISEELQTSYDRINCIIESITDAFYALDFEWNVLYMNGSGEKRLGVSLTEALGKSMLNFIPLEKEYCYALISKAIREKRAVQEEFYSLVTSSWIEARVFPWPQGVTLYIQDTTERRQMEKRIRDSQERFYKIFKASPSLMAIQSLVDQSYLDVNESWLRHSGYSIRELLSGKADLNITIEPSEQGPHVASYGFGDAVTDVKISYSTRSGEVRTGLLSTEIIESPDDPCVLTVITDITDRVELEREIARLDRLHMIGEMAAGIAHEIRNPMTTVRGFLQLMRTNKNTPPEEIIDVMVEELNRANGIITEFLALAKNKTTDRKRNSLNEIIEAIHPLIQAEAILSGKSLKLDLKPCPDLQLDEKEIRQMILNLALNGLEAMEQGGSLGIATSRDGAEVVLEISDEGGGMEPEVQDKLGTPFFTTKEQGTGLGLAVCFSIASRHQARLTWQTGTEGTVFTVRFAAGK